MQLEPGDPAPWFDARTLANTEHNLGVLGGRWVVLFFMPSFADAGATRLLADVVSSLGRFFNDDHMVFYAVLGESPPAAEPFVQASHRGLGFMTDYDGKIAALYGGRGARLVVIDPMLKIERILTNGSAEDIIGYLQKLPAVDDFAGVSLLAPALVIPHVFEPEFCKYLIGLYEKDGGRESGFMLDKDGKTMTIIDRKSKSRSDFVIDDDKVRGEIRSRVARRVAPMMERFLNYKPTRMDRYLVSCYAAEDGGHFSRHRDNVNAAARHRRFAGSFNLNDDYEGCELIFPEFGRHKYAAPRGGGIVFSTGALHQVLPVTRGKRYAFIPFFYGESDVAVRLENNAHMHEGERQYAAGRDKLFPED